MFFITAILSAIFGEPARKPILIPSKFEIVDTVGQVPAERKVPARTYVIIQLPDSSLHYGLIDQRGELTDWLSNPIPQYYTDEM
jgi:hypothetical protein